MCHHYRRDERRIQELGGASLNFKGAFRCGSSGYYILDGTRDKRTPGHSRTQHDYAIDMWMSLEEIGRSANFSIYDRRTEVACGRDGR